MKWQSIIAGVDGSPEACRAAAMAWRIARAAGVPCILVYAVPEMWAPGGLAPLAHSPELVEMLSAKVRWTLGTQLSTEIPPDVRDALVVREGRAGVVLSEVARERGASLIVVGRQPGALERGRGGSTAHHLVRTGGPPVLVVEPTAPAARPEATAASAAVPAVCTWCDPRSGRCS